MAVVGAAFVLAWAAEAAQLDVSAGLAIGVLALIAVLPEYAVRFVFAWKGGNDVEQYGPAASRPTPRAPQLLAGPGQHDRGQPAADRHRLVDDRVHRLLAVAAAAASATRASAMERPRPSSWPTCPWPCAVLPDPAPRSETVT